MVGLLLLPAGGARAQAVQAGRPLPPVPDSLQGLTRRATTPVARMDALQRVAEAYSSQSDSTGALAYGRALGALARQQHSALYEAIALHLQSTAYYEMPLLPQALRLSLQALPLRTDVRLANTQALLGKIYDDLHQTSKALAMMRAARRTYQAAGMRRQAFSVDNSMGVLFFANYQLDSADFYMLRAAQGLHTLPGMEKREAATLVNLASVQQQRLQYAAQARYSRQALALFRAVHDSTQLGAVFNNLCAAARALDSLPQAIRYARQSLRLNRQFRRLNGEQAALNNLGSCFLKLRQTDSAAVYFRQALASTRKGGVPDNQGRYLQQLAETAEAAHQPAEALRLALEVEALDSIHRNAATTLVNLTLLAKLAQARHDDAAALTYFQRQRALEQRQAAANSSKEMASLRVKFGTERTEQQLATASGPAASAGRPIRRPAFAQKGHVFVILPITQIRA